MAESPTVREEREYKEIMDRARKIAEKQRENSQQFNVMSWEGWGREAQDAAETIESLIRWWELERSHTKDLWERLQALEK